MSVILNFLSKTTTARTALCTCLPATVAKMLTDVSSASPISTMSRTNLVSTVHSSTPCVADVMEKTIALDV